MPHEITELLTGLIAEDESSTDILILSWLVASYLLSVNRTLATDLHLFNASSILSGSCDMNLQNDTSHTWTVSQLCEFGRFPKGSGFCHSGKQSKVCPFTKWLSETGFLGSLISLSLEIEKLIKQENAAADLSTLPDFPGYSCILAGRI